MSRGSTEFSWAGRTLQSVDRAVAIVETLAGTKEGMSLSKLAEALGLAPPTLQSLLRTLQCHGWVVQPIRRGPYRLGPGLGHAHRRWLAGQDCIAPARLIITELSNRIGEYVILAEWMGSELMPLLEVYPDRELVVRGELRRPERLHVMSTGKLLLACLDEPRRQEIVAALPMPRCGPNTITSREVFLDELRSIREAGVAVCVEESAKGIAALAVPLPGSSAQNPVVLGISMPMARYSPSRREELIADLRGACEAITEAWA